MSSERDAELSTRILERLLNGRSLVQADIEALAAGLLARGMADVQIAAIVTALRMRGESADELTTLAKVLREHAKVPPIPDALRPFADNCGTGGDRSDTFNISTAAAIVAAAAGARLVKHGNRAASSLCGSADLLFALGFPEDLSVAGSAELFQRTGFTFFFAPKFHHLMSNVRDLRRLLGVRTIFNLLGPLANPIRPEIQLCGVGEKRCVWPMAEAMLRLGVQKAMVVHSRDGLDELSPLAPTDYVLVSAGRLTAGVIHPERLALEATAQSLKGGKPEHNRDLLRPALAGKTYGLSDAIALNAGALLWLCERAGSLPEGLDLARQMMQSLGAAKFLDKWLAEAANIARAQPS